MPAARKILLLMFGLIAVTQLPVLGADGSCARMDEFHSAARQIKPPAQVVKDFYQATKTQYWRSAIPRYKSVFSRELYDLLVRADRLNPESGDFLDYDPFSNSQMGVAAFSVGAAKVTGATARVPITVIPGDSSEKPEPGVKGINMVVLMKLEDGSWKIDDLDSGGGEKKLKQILKELLKIAAKS